MSLDRTKVLDQAQKHLAKGALDKAIAEYQKLVQEDPSDVRTWLKIGDLYTRRGQNKEAIQTYARVADTYAKQGFFLKAVAVYKQILKLEPAGLDTHLRLAEMYEQLALVSDALSTYEQVAGLYARAGDAEKTLSTLAKMCELDSENISVRIKYAESLSKAGRTKEAADSFEIGARLLKEQGRVDDFMKVGERLLYHRPDDAKLARELAELYLERSDAKRALGKLQVCFKADPRDVKTLELLAEAFLGLSQMPKAISVYRELARIHADANRAEDRARILKRILELDPNDGEARQALAGYATGPQRAASDKPASVVKRPEPRPARSEAPESIAKAAERAAARAEAPPSGDEEDILIVDDDALEAEPGPAAGPSIPPEVAREAQIARLLTECDVFARYGLKPKVIDQLHRILAIEPAHVEARDRLARSLADVGRHDEAVGELRTLVEQVLDRDPQAAVGYLERLLAIDPSDDDARGQLAILSDDEPPTTADDGRGDALGESERPDDGVMFVDDDTAAAPSVPPPRPESGPPGFDENTVMNEPVDEAPHAMRPPPRVTRPAIPPEPVTTTEDDSLGPATVFEHRLQPRDEGGDELAPMSPEEFEALRPSGPDIVPRPSLRPPGVSGADVEDILDEADFFVAQGLLEEARATLDDALRAYPGHPLVKEKLNEIAEHEAQARASQAAAAPPPSSGEDESFLLAEKLAEELGTDSGDANANGGADLLDVDQVFAQFKKGVEEQIGLEDSDTHFDLGIAYKEMGLLEDAVHEFELARQNPQKECLAHTMIGLCFVEKGSIPEAIGHFKKGLYCDTKTEREELGLYFELGIAYELLHDPKEALYYFQKVQKRDATFRGVVDRIKVLSQPRPPPPPARPAAGGGPEDVDRAFDDLLGDGDKA